MFHIKRNPTVIGRSNSADVVLRDAAVADFHARITNHSFGYTVEDLSSVEGTFLGGCLFSGRTAGRSAAAAIL